MKYLSLAVMLCLFHSVSWTQTGQDVHFDFRVPYDTIGLNEQLQLQFTLSNAEINHIEIPQMPGFEVMQQPSRSQSVSIINGRRSSKVTFTYFLRPTSIGTFYLPSIPVESSAGLFETMELPVTVVAQAPQRRAPAISQSPFGFPPQRGLPNIPQMPNMPDFDWNMDFNLGDMDMEQFFQEGFNNLPDMSDMQKQMEEFWKDWEQRLPQRPAPSTKDKKKQYSL